MKYQIEINHERFFATYGPPERCTHTKCGRNVVSRIIQRDGEVNLGEMTRGEAYLMW